MMKKWFSRALVALALISAAVVPLAYAATLYSSNVCIPKPTPGDPASQNTWGALLNTGADIIDGITSGNGTINVAGAANVVLTFTCGSLDQTDAAHFTLTGVLTGNIYVLWPNGRSRMFGVTNNTTGSFTLSLGANNGGVPAGAVVTIAQGQTGLFRSDGTNVYSRVTSGGVYTAANSVVGNATAGALLSQDLAIPTCTGGLTYATGTGFGCNAGGGGGGGGGSGLAFGGTMTTNFAAAASTIYCVDTSGGSLTMTLPATPTVGVQIVFTDCNSSFSASTLLTVANNGNNLMGFNQNMLVGTANAGATLVYSGVTYGWRMY